MLLIIFLARLLNMTRELSTRKSLTDSQKIFPLKSFDVQQLQLLFPSNLELRNWDTEFTLFFLTQF